ncbi:MAG: SH3 domain-containing protein [Spirochaetes bacterium]|nr:SH3 domain-containing protein [Spirochaetota bacterium]
MNTKNFLYRSSNQVLIILSIILLLISCSSRKVYYASPVLLPGTERRMKTPGFWISRHPYPDRLILDEKGIRKINRYIMDKLKVVRDVSGFSSEISGVRFKENLIEHLKQYKEKKLYLMGTGKKAGRKFYEDMEKYMDLESIRSNVRVRFGFVTYYAHQRVFPTTERLHPDPENTYYDKLQNSAYDIGTPLAILHKTGDNKWVYVIGPWSSGWMLSENIAFCSIDRLKTIMGSSRFVVSISSKSDIYLDPGLKEHYDYIRMGVKLPLYGKYSSQVYQVLLPRRSKDGKMIPQKAYVKSTDVHIGYLPYTPRIIIQQAFEMMNDPYGWGGMYGEQDCSKFIQQIFATVGINMPRNSYSQGKAGTTLARFTGKIKEEEKLEVFKKAKSGFTILQLNGHIMLYLGMVNDTPYAIHSTSSYQEEGMDKNAVRIINRVIVSDIWLGKGGEEGSYLERLLRVTMISR